MIIKAKNLIVIFSFAVSSQYFFCGYPSPKPPKVNIIRPQEDEKINALIDTLFIEWEKIESTISYWLQIDDTNTFKTPIFDTTTVENKIILPNLSQGNYFLRIKRMSEDSVFSDWSDLRRFSIVCLELQKRLPLKGYPYSIFVSLPYIFIASGQVGLEIFHNDNPLKGYSDESNVLYGLCANEDKELLFLAYGKKELSVLDISNLPDTVREIYALSWPVAFAYDLDLIYDTIVAIAAKEQFLVVNVAEPEMPQIIDQIHFPSSLRGVFTSGPYIYLACEQQGVFIYKLTEQGLLLLANIDTPNNARDLVLKDSLLYVADGRGISVINVKNPSQPIFLKEIPVKGYAQKLGIKDNLLAVACGDGGLQLYKTINAPNFLRLLAKEKLSLAQSVWIDDSSIYVGARDEGLLIYKIKSPMED